MNKWQRFEELELPPRECFNSSLREQECSEEEYARAQKLWRVFGCRSLAEYHELYLKCDVLLLADIFQSFRAVCEQNYSLDPAHYVSSPSLSWDAMLKITECNLEVFEVHVEIQF